MENLPRIETVSASEARQEQGASLLLRAPEAALPPAEEPSPVAPPASEAELSGPEEQSKFDWGAEIQSEQAKVEKRSAESAMTVADLTTMAISAIAGLHSVAASVTKWEGWRLTPEEQETWRAVLTPLLRSLDPKKWGLAFALIALLMLEGGKMMGYVAWRRAIAAASPPPPQSVAPTAPSKAPAPNVPEYVPLGPPLQFGDQL